MDLGQVFQREAGRVHAFGTKFSKRSAAGRVNGINEKISLGRFDQKAGVINPGYSDVGGGEIGARRGLGRDVDRPAGGAAGEFPAQDIAEARAALEVGIKKHTPVAVV